MMFLFARHSAGLLNNNHVQMKLPWLLESQLHGSQRKSYLSVPFFFHLRYEWLVRGRLYMPGQRHELHHRICNLRYGTHGYGMSAYEITAKFKRFNALWFVDVKGHTSRSFIFGFCRSYFIKLLCMQYSSSGNLRHHPQAAVHTLNSGFSLTQFQDCFILSLHQSRRQIIVTIMKIS